jgi:hypothetical protein
VFLEPKLEISRFVTGNPSFPELYQLILRVTYAPLSTSILLRDHRLLVRTDLHSPAWGSFSTLNQPVSRAKSPPPVSILKHNAKITSPPSQLWKKRARARITSNERQFNGHNFSIERIQPGNGGLYNAVDAVSDAGTFLDKT